MKNGTFNEFVSRFKDKKILVVGDVILDLYLRGEVERISPEAPVPVVRESSREYLLGGAANVAANIAALGASVDLIGVVGHDEESHLLATLVKQHRINPLFVREKNRPTSLKTRVTASRHQLLRIDRETTFKISGATERALTALLKTEKPYDAVLLVDYAKGVLTPKVVAALRDRFGPKKILVGAKPTNAALLQGFVLVALNLSEGKALTGMTGDSDAKASQIARALARMFRSSVVFTRGAHGMTAYDKKSNRIFHFPARAVKVDDTVGAGDTVLATLALMLAAGAPLRDAADAASTAAAMVIGVPGVATVTADALQVAFDSHAA